MGANDSTRFTTQVPLAIGGKTLAPGVYNAFAELETGACSATPSVAWDKTVATGELRTAAAK